MAVKGVYEMTISTHTPHARRDGVIIMASIKDLKFQLTRLMRGVTDYADVNTPQLEISTHTPHARRDPFPDNELKVKGNFNSHASCEA